MGSRLSNKIAIITGSGSGIGRSTALIFASEGAKVVVNDRIRDAGEETTRMISSQGGEAFFVYGDISKANVAQSVVKQAVETFGKIDILFNNAGGRMGVRATLDETDEKDWDKVIKGNVKTTFLMCKYALPFMIQSGGGIIINMGSQHGLTGVPVNAAYSTAKAAVIHLTKQMSLDYGRFNIRVNCLCPGPILTPRHEKYLRSTPYFDEWVAERKVAVVLGRVGQPEEVARAALFLASDESSFFAGAALVLDGGYDARLCKY